MRLLLTNPPLWAALMMLRSVHFLDDVRLHDRNKQDNAPQVHGRDRSGPRYWPPKV